MAHFPSALLSSVRSVTHSGLEITSFNFQPEPNHRCQGFATKSYCLEYTSGQFDGRGHPRSLKPSACYTEEFCHTRGQRGPALTFPPDNQENKLMRFWRGGGQGNPALVYGLVYRPPGLRWSVATLSLTPWRQWCNPPSAIQQDSLAPCCFIMHPSRAHVGQHVY